MKTELLELLREDENQIWDLAELRGALFPDDEYPPNPQSVEGLSEMSKITRHTAVIETLLEMLVAEDEVKKKTVRVDSLSLLTVNEKEYEELAKQVSGDHFADRTFYKIA